MSSQHRIRYLLCDGCQQLQPDFVLVNGMCQSCRSRPMRRAIATVGALIFIVLVAVSMSGCSDIPIETPTPTITITPAIEAAIVATPTPPALHPCAGIELCRWAEMHDGQCWLMGTPHPEPMPEPLRYMCP